MRIRKGTTDRRLVQNRITKKSNFPWRGAVTFFVSIFSLEKEYFIAYNKSINKRSWCEMITIEQLKKLNRLENIAITEHARLRLYERQITVDDIINGIETGEIIKQYEDDKPYPSCLILGFSVKSKYIHIVVSCDTDFIYLITAYFPNPDIWEDDLKSRKEH